MSPFGYTESSAEKAKTRLDQELSQVEYHLDRIASLVPHAGATTSRLEEAKEIAREVVADLHDVVDERTEVAA